MLDSRRRAIPVVTAAMCLLYGGGAHAQGNAAADYLAAVAGMVSHDAPRNASTAALIRDVYAPYVDSLVLDDFGKLQEGLATGALVPLPVDPERFNVRVRLDGANPIGEKDVGRQASYISARAATIGCLLDVASRVKSGPLEVTSLVRHLEYQQQLRLTNANAATDIPMHALGLAFDIAMVNTPLHTVMEIHDVLQRMSDAGDLLLIVERQQLVFHVVPQPSLLGWYSELYARAMTGQPWGRPLETRRSLMPVVTTEIGSVQPLPAWAAEWWAAENVTSDLPVTVHVGDGPLAGSSPLGIIGRCIAKVGEFLAEELGLANGRVRRIAS